MRKTLITDWIAQEYKGTKGNPLVDVERVLYRSDGRYYKMDELNISAMYDEFIETTMKKLQETARNYCKGFLTDDEAKKDVKSALVLNLCFLSDHGIRTRITEDNWSQVLDDYENWKQGKSTNDNCKNPWLGYHIYSEEARNASQEEKNIFFKKMEFFGFPVEYYEPLPKHVPRPFVGAFQTDVYIEDDGEFCNSSDPVGETFIFTDAYGLKSKIEIQDTIEWMQAFENPYGRQVYSGVGTIEGYTSSNPTQIEVCQQKDQQIHLIFSMRNEDYDVFRNFPLWKEYFAWSEANESIIQSRVEAVFEQLLAEC